MRSTMHDYADPRMHAEMDRCAEACHECQDLLLELVHHCLSIGGEHAEPEHMGLVMDAICLTDATHSLLHRGSMMHATLCQACAEVCSACAESCEQVRPRDPKMMRAAEACWRCAEMCGRMAGDED